MEQKYYGFGLPIDISTHGHIIDALIVVVHIFMAILFVGWLVFFVTTLIKFRARPGHQAQNQDKHFKFPAYLEVGIALFEVFLLLAFSIPVFSRYVSELPPKEQALQIRVVAEQFAWNIHYPGADGKFGKTEAGLISKLNPLGLDFEDPAAKDDINAINQMHIPVNKPVIVYLSSKDVIHSFAIPVMRVKQDAIPGHQVSLTFQAKKTGQFEIACAQLCGLGHYRMRGQFFVETQETFDLWMSKMTAMQQRRLPQMMKMVAEAKAALQKAMPKEGDTHHV